MRNIKRKIHRKIQYVYVDVWCGWSPVLFGILGEALARDAHEHPRRTPVGLNREHELDIREHRI